MSSSQPDSSPDRKGSSETETAAEWLARRDRGFTEAEATAFARWAADQTHAAAFQEMESAWGALDQLSALRPTGPASLTPDPDLLRPIEKRQRVHWWRPLLLSAGVAAALAFFFWNGKEANKPASVASTENAVFETEVGAERMVDLEDGSHLQLNTNSAVEILFSAGIRQVNLRRGEIFCAVSKDPNRPFVVKVNGLSVRAIGTAFDVLQKPQRIEIMVTEGRVGLTADTQKDKAESSPLEAGNRATVAIGGPESEFVFSPLPAEEAARRLAWRERQLDFKESSLTDVALEFNRYNVQQLVIADVDTGAVSIGGRFNPNNIDGFIRLLESSFGIVVERRDAHTLVLRRIR
jgi:transmembrane sensor